MLRGRATQPAATTAAVQTDNRRGQAFQPRVGVDNKTGGNTFASVPTAAVKKFPGGMTQAAR